MTENPPVIFLAGPTGSGKTELAIALAQIYPIRLISVDAAQVYRGMDIGTAKPSTAIRAKFPHGLIDICAPSETFTVARFCELAKDLIASAHNEGLIPLLVGGSMFYFGNLEQGLAPLPQADRALRRRIARKAERQGWPALHKELAMIDPMSAYRIEQHDRQRIQRALEINLISGRAVPMRPNKRTHGAEQKFTKIALFYNNRASLHQQLEKRFTKMLDRGLVSEVERLSQEPGGSRESVAMRAVGYRQVWSYLEGESSWQEMCEATLAATRQLAKRQLTWLRNGAGFVWMDAGHAGLSTSACTFVENKFAYWLRDFS